jgi:DNA-binding cell septation regulator SpoVG
MARRYGPDGQRQWNGKAPGEFSEQDARQFMDETDQLLKRKDDTNMPTATATETRTAAPPAAEQQQAEPVGISVTVRPIEPRGKLIGFATVTIDSAELGGKITIPDFKVFNGEKGLFVGNPSTKDPTAQSGYRDTARVTGGDIKDKINVLARDAYVAEVQALQARAAAVITAPPARINDQLDKAGQAAARDNAARQAAALQRAAPVKAERG